MREVADVENATCAAFYRHAVHIPLQIERHAFVAQLGFQAVGVGSGRRGTEYFVEERFNLYLNRIDFLARYIKYVFAGTAVVEQHLGIVLFEAELSTHSSGAGIGAVFPRHVHRTGHIQSGRIAHAEYGVYAYRNAGAAHLDRNGGLTVLAVGRVGNGEGVSGGLGRHHNVYALGGVAAGHPFEDGACGQVLGTQGNGGTQAGNGVFKAEVQIAQDAHPNVGRVGLATIYIFNRRKDVLAAAIRRDGVFVAGAYSVFEHQVFVPIDGAVRIRRGFEGQAGFFFTIDGVAAYHGGRRRGIKGRKENRVAKGFATRFVAHCHRILTIAEVEQFVGANINRRRGHRVVERGVALGQNGDATVGEFARRGVFARDVFYNGRGGDKDKGLGVAALATVFLLIYIVDLIALLVGNGHGVANMNRRARTFGFGEPLHGGTGYFAYRVEDNVGGLRTNTVETRVLERGDNGRVRVGEGDASYGRSTSLHVAYLNTIVAGGDVELLVGAAKGLATIVAVFVGGVARRGRNGDATIAGGTERGVDRVDGQARVEVDGGRNGVGRIGVGLNALTHHAVNMDKALYPIARREAYAQGIAAVGVAIVVAIAVGAAVDTPLVHGNRRADVGVGTIGDGGARTGLGGVGRDREVDTLYNM